MFKSYFILAWRNLWKHRVSSLINIVGLSTGMACFIIILLYVNNEFSYDRYHPNADRIYRVVKDFVNDDGSRVPDATTPPALAYALHHDLPEVVSSTRLFPSWGRKYLIRYKDRAFYEETGVMRIDSNFFDVFDFPFKYGNKRTAFKGPLSILLTETSCRKYFGQEDPMGKTLRININNGQDFVVTGVLKDIPANSHFTFDFLFPFVSRIDSTINRNWAWNSFYTYALLRSDADGRAFGGKLQPLFNKYQPENRNRYYAQRLTDIHLRSNLKWELGINGDLSYIRILMAIATFVIIIAGINYVNLITGRSASRAKEVGIRKVSGASRRLLMFQFLTESVCMAFLSLGVAVLTVQLLLPIVNQLMNRDLLLFSSGYTFWIELVAITLTIGLMAGLYPALHLSSFHPVRVLKGKFIASWQGVYLRKGLVVFQFAVSIVLLISFLVIYRQLSWVMQKDLGFNTDNILLVPNVRATGLPATGAPGSWTDDLKRIPAVTGVARADGLLGGVTETNGVSVKGRQDHISLNFFRIDHAFLPTLGIALVEGRNFFGSRSDSSGIILNEKAVEQLGLKKPYVGQTLEWDEESGHTHPVTVVGVVKDFHFTSLHEPIKPFGFLSEENNGSTFLVKLHSRDLPRDMAAVAQAWTRHNPDKPFDYTFQDEQITRLYQSDMRFRKLFSGVTILAVLIASLGLLGLSVFTAEARSKEIGIRKVLGAGTGSLFLLLSRDFLLLVLLAATIASPLAWWAMTSWLRNFAYRTNIPWWIFPLAGSLAVLVALVTISVQSLKAAVANPVKSLRAE